MNNKVKRQINSYLEELFEEHLHKYDFPEIKHIKSFTASGGKRIRPLLMLYGYLAAGGTQTKLLLKTATSLELAQSYLLIHDDIIDHDTMRRNKPTLWYSHAKKTNTHYGQSLALLEGDIACALSYQPIFDSNFSEKLKLNALKLLNDMFVKVNHGQYLDLHLQYKKNFTRKNVLDVYTYKTAIYTMEAPLKLGALLGGGSTTLIAKLSDYAIPLGQAFQIHDDILGIYGTKTKTGKPTDSDIKEGKKTLLLYWALRHASPTERKKIHSIVGNEQATRADLVIIKEIMNRTGSLDYATRTAQQLVQQAKQSLDSMRIPARVKNYLTDITDFIINRSH